MTSFRFETY
jgi:hypothetical protein